MVITKEINDTHINDRVECDGARGTIKWIGQLPITNETWFGVDWDDGARGKHDGTYNKHRYFVTNTSKSGSFVKPSKVNLGINLEDGIRGRYQDDTNIEDEVTAQLKRNIKARFVEVVGMEKVGKRQSQIDTLETIVLSGWPIYGAGKSNLESLLPRIRVLDLSDTLLSSWTELAKITKQLPTLYNLNVSRNRMTISENPKQLIESTEHVKHVIANNMGNYSWTELMECAKLFPYVKKMQLAYNNLVKIDIIPQDVFQHLQDIDVGANPISNWLDISLLGTLPNLEIMNLCHCNLILVEFPETPINEKTPLFPKLKSLMLANNPLSYWESVSELQKLACLEELSLNHDAVDGFGNYFMEFTIGRISSLRILNRSRVTYHEKRDFELFYLRHFCEDYYLNGGTVNPEDAKLTPEFIQKHPSYLSLSKVQGIPLDDRNAVNHKSQKLRDLKIEVTIKNPDNDQHADVVKTFLPSTKIFKVKMMIKRAMKLAGPLQLQLSYISTKSEKPFEIDMDNDIHEIQYYSVLSGDTIYVRW